jgi:serine-type D-Ala-D-Ala carboxypeptidase
MDDFSTITRLVENATANGTAPGIALAFGHLDQPLYARSFGYAALSPSEQPLRANTLFDLASLTKTISTTLLCLQHQARGQLDPDANLSSFMPDYYPTDKATLSVRSMLSHTAGFPSHVAYYKDIPPQLRPSRLSTIDRILSTPMAHAQQQQAQYSDLGPILVGDLLEHLSGLSLDRLFERDLAQPLGLANTFYIDLDAPLAKARRPPSAFAATENCAWRQQTLQGQVHDENAYLLAGVAGHAGLFADLQDLVILARHMLKVWEGDESVLPLTGLRQCATIQYPQLSGARTFGWEAARPDASCGRLCSAQAFGHTGFTGTSLWLDLQRRAYVVLLSNRVHPTRNNQAFKAFRPKLHDAVFKALDQR